MTPQEEGYANCVIGIVRMAVKDLQSGDQYWRHDAERFFYDPWFEALTGFDGKMMLRKIKRKIMEDLE